MAFQKAHRNWKKVQPNSLREAFRLCKDYAREKKNLSVERIAELIDASPDALYKWLSNASMPAGKIATYEHVCGVHFVSDYLAASNNRLVINIPTGRSISPTEINDLQLACGNAIQKLIRYYRSESSQEDTLNGLNILFSDLAWHRENVLRAEQPELELDQ